MTLFISVDYQPGPDFIPGGAPLPTAREQFDVYATAFFAALSEHHGNVLFRMFERFSIACVDRDALAIGTNEGDET